MSAVSDVLNAAADLIERDGWVQGSAAAAPRGPTCAGIAIQRVADGGESARMAAEVLLRFLGLRSDCWGYRTIRWNDAPGRTQAEVVAAFRAAAERAA